MFDQDETAMSDREGAEETEREQEKLSLLGGRKAGPLRRGDSGCWRSRRGGTAGTGGAAEVAEAGVHSFSVRSDRVRVKVMVRVRVRYVRFSRTEVSGNRTWERSDSG